MATVEIAGVTRQACLDLLDRRPEPGDYLLVHAGYAIHLVDPEEARQTLRYLEEAFGHETQG
jgi:hydrogenase expression/formation protein HypC